MPGYELTKPKAEEKPVAEPAKPAVEQKPPAEAKPQTPEEKAAETPQIIQLLEYLHAARNRR